MLAKRGTGVERLRLWSLLGVGLLLCWPTTLLAAEAVRPMPRPADLGVVATARWDFRAEGDTWTRAALRALRSHGAPLTNTEPADIGTWCPGYVDASPAGRRAFWVGLLSALAKHESTWRPTAVGGGGSWYGLLQILPSTARLYGCKARSGSALKDGSANLSCAIRIMTRTVPRDGVIAGSKARWGGVAADWGPMRSAAKRQEMATWLRGQEYCQMHVSPRPRPRPMSLVQLTGRMPDAQRPRERPEPVRLTSADAVEKAPAAID